MNPTLSVLHCLEMREIGLLKPHELQMSLANRAMQHIADDVFFATTLSHRSPINAQPQVAYWHEYVALSYGVSTTLWNVALRIKLWNYITPISPRASYFNSYLCRTVYVDESQRILQIYISLANNLKLELIDRGKLVLSKEFDFHPKKVWMHNGHVFFMVFELSKFWLYVWNINQNALQQHEFKGCDRDIYQDIEPAMNKNYFVISAGTGLYSKFFVYNMKMRTFKDYDLGFAAENPQTVEKLHLVNNRLYAGSDYVTDRLKYQITVFDLEREIIEERFCGGLNGIILELKSTPSHLIYRIYDRGNHSLFALDLSTGKPQQITALSLISFNSALIFVEGDLINLFFRGEFNQWVRMVVNIKTGITLHTVPYSNIGLFSLPFFYGNVMFLPYYSGQNVDLYIEDFNSFIPQDTIGLTKRVAT